MGRASAATRGGEERPTRQSTLPHPSFPRTREPSPPGSSLREGTRKRSDARRRRSVRPQLPPSPQPLRLSRESGHPGRPRPFLPSFPRRREPRSGATAARSIPLRPTRQSARPTSPPPLPHPTRHCLDGGNPRPSHVATMTFDRCANDPLPPTLSSMLPTTPTLHVPMPLPTLSESVGPTVGISGAWNARAGVDHHENRQIRQFLKKSALTPLVDRGRLTPVLSLPRRG